MFWLHVSGKGYTVRKVRILPSINGSLRSKFVLAVSEILRQLDRHQSTDNITLAKQLLIRAEDRQSVLRAVLGRVAPIGAGSQLVEDIELLHCVLGDHINEWTLRQVLEHPRLVQGTYMPSDTTVLHEIPHYDIKEDLESLLELGFNFCPNAEILGYLKGPEKDVFWSTSWEQLQYNF